MNTKELLYVAVEPVDWLGSVPWQWRWFVGPFDSDAAARTCHMHLLSDKHTQMFWEYQTVIRGRTEANTIAPGTREEIWAAIEFLGP